MITEEISNEPDVPFSQRLANVIEIIEEVAFRRMDCRIASYLFRNVNSGIKTVRITHEAYVTLSQNKGNLAMQPIDDKKRPH